MKQALLSLLFVCYLFAANAQTSVIPFGSSWKYLDNGTNQGTAWRSTTFNDGTWKTGNAQLGYGDGDETTVVSYGSSSTSKYITTYFRKSVNITSAFTSYTLRVKRDDGIVVYVNGTEVYRNNMPTGTITSATLAPTFASDDGNTILSATLGTANFISGTNVIAVEMHQNAGNSSDLSFDLELTGNGGSSTGCGTPSSLSFAGITQTSATVNWGAVSAATSYNLQYKTAAATTWTTVSNLTGTSYNVTGLTAGTTYNYQVQSNCNGTLGNYSAFSSFTTNSAAGTINEVVYQWSGAIQSSSAVVVAKLTSASTTCRLVVSTSSALTSPVYGAFTSASSTNNLMAKMSVTGLAPGTTYFYAVESNGVVDNSSDDIGKFTTPAASAFSFKFTVGSCAVNSNHQVYTLMNNKAPLFHMSTGDFHYANPNSGTNINVHRTPYESNMLSQTPSRNFFKNTALAYVWDDHDYCGDNSGGASAGRANARQAYREYVPHYTLAAGSGNAAIYQSFTIGRVHFILSDLRSERASGTMMGSAQKTWFKNQCLFARDNNLMIAWITPVSFGGTSSDNWGGFSAERTELSNFFRDNNIRNMFLLSGDAHMLAIDNGINHDFSTGSNNANDYPVFQAAAVNNSGSTKGGTYSQGGTFPNNSSSNGQYGLVEVTDNGGTSITVKFTGYRTAGNTASESVLTNYTFTRTLNVTARLSQQPIISLRSVEGGRKIQVAWDNTDVQSGYKLLRSGDNKNFETVTDFKTATGVFTDLNPENGWNYYRVVNSRNKTVQEKAIFIQGKAEMKLFPNPAATTVNIQINDLGVATNGRYMIYNTKMKTVLQGNLLLNRGNNNHSLNISTLTAGTYIIHIVVNGVEISEKLVVTK
jgi:PhoD-like phosphatase/Fibronectin type III domain/Secretion system C-terminal sorting domain